MALFLLEHGGERVAEELKGAPKLGVVYVTVDGKGGDAGRRCVEGGRVTRT